MQRLIEPQIIPVAQQETLTVYISHYQDSQQFGIVDFAKKSSNPDHENYLCIYHDADNDNYTPVYFHGYQPMPIGVRLEPYTQNRILHFIDELARCLNIKVLKLCCFASLGNQNGNAVSVTTHDLVKYLLPNVVHLIT